MPATSRKHEQNPSGEKRSPDRIMDAAELLFAEYGYKACTFKQISETGEVNQGLLHYHFGTKEALFRKVFLRRAEPLSAARIARLALVQDVVPGEAATVADIVRAYLDPVLEVFESGPGPRAFLRIHAQMKADPFEFSLALRRQAFGATTTVFLKALQGACPHLSAVAVSWRMQAMIGAYQLVVSQGGRIEDFLAQAGGRIDMREAFDQLIAFAVAGFTAPEGDKRRPKSRRKSGDE